MTVRILLNPASGPDSDRDSIETALRDSPLDGDLQWLDGKDAAEAAERAVADGVTTLVVGGGDGTISAVAGALAGTPVKLGILPLGTLNHFARDLGIPDDVSEAARLITEGKRRAVDVAEVNGRIFLNNSAIGLYPLMVVDRDLQRKRLGRSKRLALLVASARTFVRFRHQRLRLRVNDQEAIVETPLLFVGNNDYRVDIGGPGKRESLDGGELFVLVMRSQSRLGLLAATARALFGRARATDMVELSGVTSLQVDGKRSHLPVSMDGEVVTLQTPLDYRIRPKALTVIAP